MSIGRAFSPKFKFVVRFNVDRSGLQPSDAQLLLYLGLAAQAGIGRAFSAGVGRADGAGVARASVLWRRERRTVVGAGMLLRADSQMMSRQIKAKNDRRFPSTPSSNSARWGPRLPTPTSKERSLGTPASLRMTAKSEEMGLHLQVNGYSALRGRHSIWRHSGWLVSYCSARRRCSAWRTSVENSETKNPMAAPPMEPPKVEAVSWKLRLMDG